MSHSQPSVYLHMLEHQSCTISFNESFIYSFLMKNPLDMKYQTFRECAFMKLLLLIILVVWFSYPKFTSKLFLAELFLNEGEQTQARCFQQLSIHIIPSTVTLVIMFWMQSVGSSVSCSTVILVCDVLFVAHLISLLSFRYAPEHDSWLQ